MDSAAQHAALKELTARGLIASSPAPRPLNTGNSDRRSARAAWIVFLPDNRLARLVLARDLRAQATRHSAFLRDCPQLASHLFFHETLPQGEALAEEFLPGRTISDNSGAPTLSTVIIQSALAKALHGLALTEQASTETARRTEWDAWASRIAGLPDLSRADSILLRERVLPPLYDALTFGTPAYTRWSNGDFHADNLLVDTAGTVRVVDLEFAQRTHFFREDAVRFHVLSAVARRYPDWFNALPDPGPAWHLYFWIRQLELEVTVNSRAYRDRTAHDRLAVIRRLAEQVLDTTLEGWSVPSLPVSAHVEESLIAADMLTLAGWCHVPSGTALRSIAVLSPIGKLAETPPFDRADVQAHFQGEPQARLSGFKLRVPLSGNHRRLLLAVQDADGTLLPFHAIAVPAPAGEIGAPLPSTEERLLRTPLAARPFLSVVMPVYDPPLAFLERAVASVIAQSYPHWELCIVDDASTNLAVRHRLQELAGAEPRIRLQIQSANGGISRATNAGLAHARGSHTAFLDHDDELAPGALAEVASLLLEAPDTDVIYTDQDKCDETGARFEPFRKPDWSPVYFLGAMYVGHLLVARTGLLRSIGGCDEAYDRVQDYELMLRLSERTTRIAHIPKILYHWRVSPCSIALSSSAKGPVDDLQATAVQAHLARGGHKVRAISLHRLPHRIQLLPADEHQGRLISIILTAPGRSNVAPVTTHLSYEVVDDVAAARGECLLILQPGMAIDTPDWLQVLLTHLDLPGIGAVSPLIIGRHNRVEYAGDPSLIGLDPIADGPGGSLACSREVPSLSSACFMVKRSLFLACHGSVEDAARLTVELGRRNLSLLYAANVILRRSTA